MRFAEYAAALVVAALGSATIILARRLPYSAEYGPGAGFLPLWLGIALVILSVILLREAMSDRLDEGAAALADSAGEDARIGIGNASRKPWLIFFASTVALALLFEPLGLWVSTALFTLVTVRWVGQRPWLATIIFTIVTPIALYVGFVRLLLVPLPMLPFGS